MNISISNITNNNINLKQVSEHKGSNRQISFGIKKQLYAITTTREAIFFDTVKQAAEKLETLPLNILRVLNKITKSSNNLIFEKPENILDSKGRIDFQKVKTVSQKLKSICIIDKNNNIYTPINNKHAESILGTSHLRLKFYLRNRKINPQGKAIVYRTEVEDQFGNLDPNKAKSIWKELSSKTNEAIKKIYVVDKKRNISTFNSVSECAKQFNIDRSTVHAGLRGARKTVKGYTILKPSLIETPEGKIDKEKFEAEIRKRFSRQRRPGTPKEILVMNKKGEIELFKTVKDVIATSKKGLTATFDILKGKRPLTKEGWHFAYANKLKDENGNIDPIKVQELHQKIFTPSPSAKPITPTLTSFVATEQKQGIRFKKSYGGSKREILAINADGTVKVFPSQKEAAQKAKISTATIYRILIGKRTATMDGWHYTYTKNLKDQSGKIDEKKIQEIHDSVFGNGKTYTKKTTPQPIYAISRNGEVKVFKTKQEAADGTNICKETVGYILNGKRPATLSGWTYVRADKLKDENGEISQSKIDELRKKIFEKEKILGLNKNGKIVLYNSKYELEKATQITRYKLTKILNGQRKHTSDEWHYVYADKLRDETGKIPKAKIKEYFESIFGSIRTNYTYGQVKDKKIIGIHQSGQIKIFQTMEEAERKTDIGAYSLLSVINGERDITRKGWHYVLADKYRDQNGKIAKEKILELYKKIFN